MAQAYRDENNVPTLIASSNVDGFTPVRVYADPVTHRLLVDSAGGGSGTVTSVSVVTNQGVSGSVATATTTPAITLSLGALTGVTSFNGLVVTANTGAITTGSWAATAIPLSKGGTGADLSAIVKGGIISGTGAATVGITTVGADGTVLSADAASAGGVKWIAAAGSGTVTTVSVVSANGFAGTVANATTTPAITISTSINSPVLAGNGTAISAATTTGTGSTVVLQGTPTLTTPVLGVATATSINKMAITAPASSSTLAVADGKTFTVSNTLTFTGTDTSSVAFGAGGTVLYTASTVPLTVGNTTIASGTNTRILYDNSGVLGEYTLTGSGTVVAMQTAPTFVTSIQSPLVIGGSGTTGTQLTLKTTTGNGTTDALVIAGGNNGATTFATFTTGALTITTSGVFTTGTIELGAASDTTIARVSAGVASIEGATIVVNASSPTLGTITTTGTIELGNASDTTLSRSSGGVLAVEGVVVPTISSTSTLTNKRITRRVVTVNAPGATPTTNSDNDDIAAFTGLGTAITSMTTNLSGTPVNGDLLEFRFTDDGTARGITWGTSFQSTTVTLPTTTVISTMLRVGFEWNSTASKWDCIAVA